MISSPELREGTLAATRKTRKPRRLTVLQAWDDIGPVHAEPSLPLAVTQVRAALAPGWRSWVAFRSGYTVAKKKIADLPADQRPPEPVWNPGEKRKPPRLTTEAVIPLASVTLRCRHLDGRAAVAGWILRTDKEAWAFSGPAYCWMPGMNVRPYECSATEWAELMAWSEEEMAA